MRILFFISFFSLLLSLDCAGQKRSKSKKDKLSDSRRRAMEEYGDSIRTDSVVIYETEIGYVMPDFSSKFKGRWDIQVMRRQARAIPDSLRDCYFEFNEDTLFTAYLGCNKLHGYYIIKGPTIKFTVTDTALPACQNDIEQWFVRLIQERVSYFGIDEKILYLKDVAYNIVFDCARKPELSETQ